MNKVTNLESNINADTQQLIYTEAKDLRKEHIGIINNNITHLWNVITLSLLLIGAYTSISLYILEHNGKILCLPFMISVLLILIVLLISVFTVSSVGYAIIPDQDRVYSLLNKDYDEVLATFTETYLISNKRYASKIEEYQLRNAIILSCIIFSVYEYILFIGRFINENETGIINATSAFLFVVLVILIAWIFYLKKHH